MIKLNRNILEVKKFPNGETLLDLAGHTIARTNRIDFYFDDNEDLLNLMFLKKHLDDLNTKSHLHISYMPYSRMDRVEGTARIFTLKYICDFINSLDFYAVSVVEAHSDVTLALLNKCTSVDKTEEVTKRVMLRKGFDKNSNDYLVYPDAGAEKRYSKSMQWDKTLTAIKHRDFETGYINSLQIVGNAPTEPFRAIIMDDLCSRGGTFIMTARELREMGATEIILVVSHAEKTIFEGEIFNNDLIDVVYCTNSLFDKIPRNIPREKILVDDVRGM